MNCPWEYADPKEQGGKCVICCMECGHVLKIPCQNDPKKITGCARISHGLPPKRKPWLHNLGDHVAVMLAQIGITKERYRKAKELLGLKSDCGCQQRQEALNELGKAISENLPG